MYSSSFFGVYWFFALNSLAIFTLLCVVSENWRRMVAERLVLVNGKFFQRFCCAFAALFQPERIDIHRDAHAKGLALCVQPGGQLRQFFLQGGAAVGLHE